MWSRLLLRPSLLALRSPSITKGEKLFSSVGGRLQQRSRQLGSTLPSFCKLYTTDLQNNTEPKNDVEKVEEKIERSTSKHRSADEKTTSTSRSKAKRKNTRLSKKQTNEETPNDENMTHDEKIFNQLKTTKTDPQTVLRLFNELQHKTVHAYTLAIKAHIDLNSLFSALDLWYVMEKDPNVKLNTLSYNKLMHIHHELHQYDKVMEVYHHIAQHYKPNIETFHRLVMMATSPEVDSVEQLNWIASEMQKYVTGDFFLMYEMFKFYANHDLWESADKYLAIMKEQTNLPSVFPLVLKVAELLKLVKTNPAATEEINSLWDNFNKSIKPREVSYYGRFLNELLTTQILEHFLKHDDARAHELIERIALIMRDSEARAVTIRQLVVSAQNAYRLDILPDFEQCLAKHKRRGIIADLGFTYAYNGLTDNLRLFLESPISEGLMMSQVHHIVRGVFWSNTASKTRRYYTVPKEGFDTAEQHLKNIEIVQDLLPLLNKKFGFEPTVETKTLMALAYIKARKPDQAREVLADVDPEKSTYNLYKKTMKYLDKIKDRPLGSRTPNNFWREVSGAIENQDIDHLKKLLADNPLSNFSASLLQRAILTLEKTRLVNDAIDLCNRIMTENSDKMDVQLCRSIVRVAYTYKQKELAEQAFEAFKTGPWQPARLDFRVTNIVLNYYIFSKQLSKAEDFFQYCIQSGSMIRPYSFGRLLSQVLAEGRLRDAWIYFIQQRTCPLGPRSVENNAYSSLITMLIYNKLTPYAVALFNSMKEDCVLPDRFVYKQFCDMIFGRKQFKGDEVQVLDASGQQVSLPEQVAEDLSNGNVSSDAKQNTTGESIATIHSSQKNLPKLLALMQLPLEGLPERTEFKLRVAKQTVRTPKMK